VFVKDITFSSRFAFTESRRLGLLAIAIAMKPFKLPSFSVPSSVPLILRKAFAEFIGTYILVVNIIRVAI
jgi:hypothetical protein